jgi:hypothetical protein
MIDTISQAWKILPELLIHPLEDRPRGLTRRTRIALGPALL